MSIGLEPRGLASAFARGAPSLTSRRLGRLTEKGRSVQMKRHWLCLALGAVAVIMVSAFAVVSFATDSESGEKSEEKATPDEGKEEGKKVIKEKTYTVELVHHTDPEYPEDARKDGAGGKVVLKMTIDAETGVVGDILVLKEVADYPSLADAAVAAASDWTFKVHGDPEGDVEVVVPISFKMDGPHTKELKVKIPDATDKPVERGKIEKGDEPAVPEEPAEPEEAEPDKPEAPEGGA